AAVAVGTVLVLADPGRQQRRLGQFGEALGEEDARPLDALLRGDAVAGARVVALATCVVGNFQPFPLDVRDAVDDPLPEIDKDRKMSGLVAIRTLRRGEVVDL